MFETLDAQTRRYNVLYLDECPHAAAKAVADQHVHQALTWAVQVLSAAWWGRSLPAEEAVGEVLKLEWRPDGQAPPGQGQWSHASLFGQRIYFTGWHGHPCVAWAEALGGNYEWLWRYASELDAVCRSLGRIHGAVPALRVLEAVPPSLLPTVHQWYDAPAVVPAGYERDSQVESYRAYYGYQLGLKYITRERPPWL
jgi:hypothetical protein